MYFKANFDLSIGPNTSLKYFPYSLYHKFCNVLINDVWEQIASKILNRSKTAPKFSYDDIYSFRRCKRPAEEMMNSWKMDNPPFSDLLIILKEEQFLRAVTFIEENVFGYKNADIISNVTCTKSSVSNKVNKAENIWQPDKTEKPSTTTSSNAYKIPYKTLSTWTSNFNMMQHLHGGNFISSGGFADVFLGRINKNRVAVKRFKHSDDHFEVDNVLFDLKHSNLVKLYNWSDDGAYVCVVYEFMAAGSLFDCLCDPSRIGSVGSGRRLMMATQTASALHYLHNKHIVHTNVKSGNIFLTSNMDVKLSEFGISKRLNIEDSHVATATMATTMVYKAPEYLFNHEVSSSIDMFSFGVVLLELVYGQPAYNEHRTTKSIVEMFENGATMDGCWKKTGKNIGKKPGNDTEDGMGVLQLMHGCLCGLVSRRRELRATASQVLETLFKLQAAV